MAINASTIQIRGIKALQDLKAVEDLQKEVWGVSDLEVFPRLALIPLLEIGGVLLGAFDGESLVGFVLGFPGIENGRPILHSDMLAVKREFRGQGLGYRLKLSQRESALAKGIEKITWTFDPLQSLNAHLNFAKLGVFSDRYEPNFYGETSSPLHSTGTDRLWVTWDLNSRSVITRIEPNTPTQEPSPDELVRARSLVQIGIQNEPVTQWEALQSETASIDVPRRFNELLEDRITLALAWRGATRSAFTNALKASFVVKDFGLLEKNGVRFGRYLLRKKRRESS